MVLSYIRIIDLMAKIAIDARIINSTTGRYVERLLYYLEQIDHSNHYLILVRKKDINIYTPTNPNFEIIEADFDDYSLSEQIGLKRLLDSLKPDLVHFCMPQQPVLYRGAHVTTVHDLTLLRTYSSDKNYLVYKFKQFVGRFVFKYVAKSSNKIITPSKFTKDSLVKFANISPDKVIVTYEGADKSATKPSPIKDLQNTEYIMYVGNQSDYKNIRRLVEAHQLLRQKHPHLLLVLVGRLSGVSGASLRRNKTWVEQRDYEGVIFTDFVSDEQLAWLYLNAQAYVFPSLMEGFGLPGLEAMLYGTPVVSSNATCLPEIYGDAAHYFDPKNVLAIADAIAAVIDSRDRREALVKKGHAQVARYSWKRTAEQTLAVYKHVLGQRN